MTLVCVHADTPADIVAAAKKVRAAFVPTLEDLNASYAAEAKAAIDKTPALTGLATELALFPVVGGQTTVSASNCAHER